MSFVEYCKEEINDLLRNIKRIAVAKTKDEKITRAILCGVLTICVSLFLFSWELYLLAIALVLLGMTSFIFSLFVYPDYLDWKEKKEVEQK